jgi:hypothetical protein
MPRQGQAVAAKKSTSGYRPFSASSTVVFLHEGSLGSVLVPVAQRMWVREGRRG